MTHVRLFRSLGLNGGHFDVFMDKFSEAMNICHIDGELQNEILSVLYPMRAAFEYGSEVARAEQALSREEFRKAPTATAESMQAFNVSSVKLPPGVKAPPRWLVRLMGSRETVRAWTCELTKRLTVDDPFLSQTFMEVPYLHMETYCHALLQFAFADVVNEKCSIRTLQELRFPTGLAHAQKTQVSQEMFEHIVNHFYETGYQLSLRGLSFMDEEELYDVKIQLLEQRRTFVCNGNELSATSCHSAPGDCARLKHHLHGKRDPGSDGRKRSLSDELRTFNKPTVLNDALLNQTKKTTDSKTRRKHTFYWFRRFHPTA